MTVYLSAQGVKTINEHFLGTPALRDEPGLLAALTRPLTAAHYQHADLATQAAVLIDGLCQSHTFLDGNKRTATAAGLIFLRLNGSRAQYPVDPLHDALGVQVLALVVHQLTVDAFAQWLRSRLVALSRELLQTSSPGMNLMQTPLRVQRAGSDLVIVLSPEDAATRQVQEGDQVIVLKATVQQAQFNQALEEVFREHAGTFEYLRDK